VIVVGLDDTDTLESGGTNRLARSLVTALPDGFRADVVLRHQLLVDPRVPYTSHNGCASLGIHADPGHGSDELVAPLEAAVRAAFVEGSDPGLCIAAAAPSGVRAWGRRCQQEVVSQADARALAATHGIHLCGLGGSGDGVVGALAAVGLRAGNEDGRVVHMAGWPWPDPLSGPQPLQALRSRGVAELREIGSGRVVTTGTVDVGKHLRPSWRGGRPILYVEAAGDGVDWRAVKLP
jgi:hypothetical protein